MLGEVGVTNTEIAELASQEACERASRALVNTFDECDDAHRLTAEQKIILGTALLREFMGMADTVERMLHTAAVMEKFEMTTIGDEVEKFLREYKGTEQ